MTESATLPRSLEAGERPKGYMIQKEFIPQYQERLPEYQQEYMQSVIKGKIMIETSWTHEEVTQQLHAWFLKAVHSTGIALKGHQKAGVNESNLWFVTQNPIPDDILKTWGAEAIVRAVIRRL
ncbi:hypothetical protein EDC04DRAFT_2607784 [Pisolithus marmoratus]|nr:hypothetical protein EDC04DRAFT_2607784 [Pisolithus marmoratus]